MLRCTSLLWLVLLVGCGASAATNAKVSRENYTKITPDMLHADVRAILGEPDGQDKNGFNSVTCRWQAGDKEILVVFRESSRFGEPRQVKVHSKSQRGLE